MLSVSRHLRVATAWTLRLRRAGGVGMSSGSQFLAGTGDAPSDSLCRSARAMTLALSRPQAPVFDVTPSGVDRTQVGRDFSRRDAPLVGTPSSVPAVSVLLQKGHTKGGEVWCRHLLELMLAPTACWPGRRVSKPRVLARVPGHACRSDMIAARSPKGPNDSSPPASRSREPNRT